MFRKKKRILALEAVASSNLADNFMGYQNPNFDIFPIIVALEAKQHPGWNFCRVSYLKLLHFPNQTENFSLSLVARRLTISWGIFLDQMEN